MAASLANIVDLSAQLASASSIKPQWFHPYLEAVMPRRLSRLELEAFAYDYYLRFMPFFRNQREGSLEPGVVIEFSLRMKNKLGVANLFARKIRLNENYFTKDPRLLPYTLFHELVHHWLYDCYLDPGHTWRFYSKMQEFSLTQLPHDPEVHIHSRIAQEAKFVYVCPSCQNRWFINDRKHNRLSCGVCFESRQTEIFPERFRNYGHAKMANPSGPLEFYAACAENPTRGVS